MNIRTLPDLELNVIRADITITTEYEDGTTTTRKCTDTDLEIYCNSLPIYEGEDPLIVLLDS